LKQIRGELPDDLPEETLYALAELFDEDFLRDRGLPAQPGELLRWFHEALVQMSEDVYPDIPRDELTVAEAHALDEGGMKLAADDLGAADPLARTAADYAALLATSMGTAETAALLGVNASRIRQRLTSSPPTLYGIRTSDGSWRIPAFQFAGGALLPGMKEVAARLHPEIHPIAVYRWFTANDPELGIEDDSAAPPELVGRSLSPRGWLLNGLPVDKIAGLAANL